MIVTANLDPKRTRTEAGAPIPIANKNASIVMRQNNEGNEGLLPNRPWREARDSFGFGGPLRYRCLEAAPDRRCAHMMLKPHGSTRWVGSSNK
jgi:hypothetical protein